MRRRDFILLLGAATVISGIAESPRILAEVPMRIYLAGPLGFSEAGRDFTDRVLVPELNRLGFQVIDPFKLTDQRKIDAVLGLPTAEARRDAWQKLNMEIGRNNQIAIDSCDAVLAVLDGADVDSGTASEIWPAPGLDDTLLS